MKNFIFVFMLASFSVCALNSEGNFESIEERTAFLNQTLISLAKQLNQQMPIYLDNTTKITSIIAVDTTMMLTIIMTDINSSDLYEFDSKASQEALNQYVCGSTNLRKLVNMGARYHYHYMTNDLKQVAVTEVNIC